jgi:hypothetical protein
MPVAVASATAAGRNYSTKKAREIGLDIARRCRSHNLQQLEGLGLVRVVVVAAIHEL